MGDFFSLPFFYPVDSQWVLTESGPAEKGEVHPFFVFTNGSLSLPTAPFTQNSCFSTALSLFQAAFTCVRMF